MKPQKSHLYFYNIKKHQNLTNMKTLNYSSKIGLFILMLQLAGNLSAQDHVFASFKGKVIINSGSLSNARAVVTDELGQSMSVFLSRNGNFRIHLPIGRNYRMTVEKPGYISKEIAIDLSQYSKKAQRANQTMEFDVVMFPQDATLEMAYVNAVGEISFHPHSGKMNIAYNHRMIPSKRGFDQLITETK
jgi:hypothetical protein